MGPSLVVFAVSSIGEGIERVVYTVEEDMEKQQLSTYLSDYYCCSYLSSVSCLWVSPPSLEGHGENAVAM